MQAARAAYDAAASGGKNSGFLRNVLDQKWGPKQMQKGIKSFQEHITRHEGYLKNPASKVSEWSKLLPQHQQRLLSHWADEIAVAKDQIGILRVLWANMP